MVKLNGNLDHEFITVNNIRLHYVTQGSGSLMLLLHGFPEFWYSWRYQIPEFAQQYKVVAPDLRGYNDSEKPTSLPAYRVSELINDVKCLIHALGYDHCVLVAHDWGGSIAWMFAYEYPHMVGRLIVINAPHLTRFAQELRKPKQFMRSWYIFLFQLPWLPELLLTLGNYRLIEGMLTGTLANPQAFTAEDLALYKQAIAKPGALTAMLNYYRNAFRPGNFKYHSSTLDVPTLMLWGERDIALSKELTYHTEKYVRNLQIRYVSSGSHWVHHEFPQLINHYMWDFLQAY